MNDRRQADRRQTVISVRYPDRRRGFPRRAPQSPARQRYHAALAAMRGRTTTIALLAGLLLALNLADLILTQRALTAGAVEVNPFMAALFESGNAVAVKLGVGAVAVGGLWALRRYRPALAALAWASTAMAVLVAYQTVLVGVIA